MMTCVAPAAAPQRVIAVVPAHCEADRIEATIAAISSISRVEHTIVVDDGSDDGTAESARRTGAQVLSHQVCQGKAQAMDTGAREAFRRIRRHGRNLDDYALLFIDADLGDSAVHCAPLVEAVVNDRTDLAIAALPPQQGSGGKGRVVRMARYGIHHATGYCPLAPLSGQRCVRARLYRDLMPMAQGWGIEVAMTIQALRAGARVLEVPCDLTHRVTGKDWRGILHRADQARAVVKVLHAQGLAHTALISPMLRRRAGSLSSASPMESGSSGQAYRMRPQSLE